MSRLDERIVHCLRIVIDRDQCVGFGDCVEGAPEGFTLDAETVAVFAEPEMVAPERLLRAADACPVDAITVYDETGRRIVPTPWGASKGPPSPPNARRRPGEPGPPRGNGIRSRAPRPASA